MQISLPNVFIESSSPWSPSRKKNETRRSLNPEATRPTDSDHLEPLALLLPAGDFRTSLVLPGCVRFITSTLISIILPLPRAIVG